MMREWSKTVAIISVVLGVCMMGGTPPKLIEVQPRTINRPGQTTTSSSFLLGHGVSVIATITNGEPGPKTPCGVRLQLSADNVTWHPTKDNRMAGAFAKAVFTTKFDLGALNVCPRDWKYGRLVFVGNMGRSVTVHAEG